MRRQTTMADDARRHTVSAGGRWSRKSLSWLLAIVVLALLLGFAMIDRTVEVDRGVPAGQDYVPVVTAAPIQKGKAAAYNYTTTARSTPSSRSVQPSVPAIDDASSAEAYKQSCLAALTREKNPEIMQLSDDVRADMCTDPRRH